MNLVQASEYEDVNVCPICRETFHPMDLVVLVRHRGEPLKDSRKHKHIFHPNCLQMCVEHQHGASVCPLDRTQIDTLLEAFYHHYVTFNLLHFDDYYELLDRYPQIRVATIDAPNLNCSDSHGKTLMYCACQRGNLTLVKQLIHWGGNPTLADPMGFTPLMASVTHGYLKLVKYLLKVSIVRETINYVDSTDRTAIDYAWISRHYPCLKELLKIKEHHPDNLQRILSQCQYLNKFDPLYHPILEEIKTMLRRSLHLPLPVDLPVDVSITNERHNYVKHETPVLPPSEVFQVDEETCPNLYRSVYHPIKPDIRELPMIQSSPHELQQLSTFENRQFELIYVPPQHI